MTRVAAVFLVVFVLMPALAAQPPSPCARLIATVDAYPAGPVFLQSFSNVEPGPLQDTAFLYDNAVAALALAGCGARGQARRIGDAMLLALDNDRHWRDGRLRNAYAAGPVDRPMKMPGWWDERQNRWLEDGYQAGSDTGNMAWVMLALLELGEEDRRYISGAERIARFVSRWRDDAGGFAGGAFGHEPNPVSATWKATEHNTDLAAAFRRLADATGNGLWRTYAGEAEAFVRSMWSAGCTCFAAGAGGGTVNPLLALDAQVWPLLAIPGAADDYAMVIETVQRRLGQGGGITYSEAGQGLWTEGTAQFLLLLKVRGRTAEAGALVPLLQTVRTETGDYYATAEDQLPTGFALDTNPPVQRLYFRRPHLAALAWVSLADRGFNPFTGAAP